MATANSTDVLGTLAKLPELIYSVLPSDPNQIIGIKRGVSGYWPIDLRADHGKPAHITAAELNAGLVPKPTPAQIGAMEHGSLFGWDTPAADPEYVAGMMERNQKFAAHLASKVAAE